MEQQFEQIEAYLRGALSPEERAAFEAATAADPMLAALVQRHRMERQVVEQLAARDLDFKMRQWAQEIPWEETPVRREGGRLRRMVWVGMAAAAAVALLVVAWIQFRQPVALPEIAQTKPAAPPASAPTPAPSKAPKSQTPQPTTPLEAPIAQTQPEKKPAAPEKPQSTTPVQPAEKDYAALAASFYRESDFMSGASGGGAANNPAYGQALQDFKAGRYDNVLSRLKPALRLSPQALEMKELAGHALYKEGRYGESVTYFSQVASAKKQPYAQRAEWALVLALLHDQPAKRALLDRVMGNILGNSAHPYYRQARELKAKMESK